MAPCYCRELPLSIFPSPSTAYIQGKPSSSSHQFGNGESSAVKRSEVQTFTFVVARTSPHSRDRKRTGPPEDTHSTPSIRSLPERRIPYATRCLTPPVRRTQSTPQFELEFCIPMTRHREASDVEAHSSLESLPSRPPLKKAVVIGINYSGRGADEEFTPLHGCSRGAREFKDFLIDVCGFESENVILMVDDEGHPLQFQPKERNILRELKNLVRGVLPDDILVLYYCDGTGKHCGHGLIKDNVLRKILVVPLLEGVCFRIWITITATGVRLTLSVLLGNGRHT
ncbi:hypothetical protein IEO21_05951 [Rhodonia placenta]|uniref:Uncharacterized protein n=1 Tax=Rhodonia placenta TaxID=104341 RepID=A0A8H7P0Y2_9APHY|nr:hypothetical protein IEO21_05951 [Postia placenta]